MVSSFKFKENTTWQVDGKKSWHIGFYLIVQDISLSENHKSPKLDIWMKNDTLVKIKFIYYHDYF